MQIPLFQVDAFTNQTFGGNPAAVCVLNTWLDDKVLQAIAEENNLSETAFLVGEQGAYQLRWFTPEAEVDLCGHATLAAAHVLFKHFNEASSQLAFQSRSGELIVEQSSTGYQLDFPALTNTPCADDHPVVSALGISQAQVFEGADLLVVVESEQQLRKLSPDFMAMLQLPLRGVIATAPGEQCDFVSRCFYPKLRINEDPVTGSAHCQMTPYWAKRLNKQCLSAIQISKRQGHIKCSLEGDRIKLHGHAADYLQGIIQLPD